MSDMNQRSRGQALVEFALVFPFVALLIFGIIDLGRFAFTANSLNNAAREGARAGSVQFFPPECAGFSWPNQRQQCIVAAAQAKVTGVTSPTTVTPTCERLDPAEADGLRVVPVSQCHVRDLLTVRVQTNFNLITPLIAQLLGSLTIAGETQVKVNQ